MLREDSGVVREHSTVLAEDDCVLREDSGVVREHSTVLAEDDCVLREDSGVLDPRLASARSPTRERSIFQD